MIEDNPADVRLAQEAFRGAQNSLRISVARDGVEAMAFLCRTGAFANAPRPDIIILDLNLPKKDGREVLGEIKSDPLLKHIPVIVFTTSAAEMDVEQAYGLHANCFISKPLDLEHFLSYMRLISEFWLATVELPVRA